MKPDLRLWPTAASVWCSCAVVASALLSPVVALLAASLTSLAVAVGWRYRRGRIAPAVLLPLVALVLATGVAGLRVWAVSPDLLPEPGSAVTIEAVVDSDPRLVEGAGSSIVRGPPRTVTGITVHRITWEGGALSARLPASLWAPADAVGLLPGTSVTGYATVLPRKPGGDGTLSLSMRRVPTVLGEAPVWQRVAGNLRAGLRDATAGLPADGAALLPGLVLGDTSTLPDALADDMRTAGLSHLTAVSGANVSIVLGAALGLAALGRVRGRGRAVVAGVALIGFLILVRPSPSVVRATAMGSVVVLSLLTGGQRRGPPALAAASIVLLLVDPWLAVSAGFALSVAATAGLLIVAPQLRDGIAARAPWLPRSLAEALSITVSAQLVTAPVLVLIGASVGLGAVPANLLAELAVAPATLLGVAATLASAVSPALAHAVAVPAVLCAQWVAWVAHGVAATAPLLIPWPTGARGAALALMLLASGALTVKYRGPVRRAVSRVPRPVSAAVVAGVVVCGVALPRAGSEHWPPTGWVAVMCDVGQGDAIVLRIDADSAVVVDAGPEPARVDRCLSDLGISRVSALLLTHFHADHVEGVPGVLRGRAVGTVLVSPLAEPLDQAERVRAWCADAGVPVEVVSAGDSRQVGPVGWSVLWPTRIIRGEGSDSNNASLTALVTVEGVRLLLGGDLEPASQAAVMAVNGALTVDVVKVPHHGSLRQNPRFGPWSGARAALVSVGVDNGYGHPAPETLQSYESRGVGVWRTDHSGDIAVVATPAGVALLGRSGPGG